MSQFLFSLVFNKIIVYIAIRCIMDTKKFLVNTSESKVAAPRFCQYVVTAGNVTLPWG